MVFSRRQDSATGCPLYITWINLVWFDWFLMDWFVFLFGFSFEGRQIIQNGAQFSKKKRKKKKKTNKY